MSGKKILMLGSSGLLSGETLKYFIKNGFEVTALSRGIRYLEHHCNLHILKADRKDFYSLSSALENKKFDFTVDFLSYDENDIKNIFSVKGFFTKRYCMISSGQVYLVTQNQNPPFKEEDSQNALIPEPTYGSYDWKNWAYGMGKRRAESALKEESIKRGFESLALRLPVVQGEKDGENSRRLWAWLERMKDGNPVILPDGGKNIVRFVYARDLALFLVRLALSNLWPSEKVLNLSQRKEINLKKFLSLAAEYGNLKTEFIEIKSDKLAEAKIPDFCYPYWGKWTSRLDSTRALSLPYARVSEFDEYLPSVVKAHLENRTLLSHEGYMFRKKELELIKKI